MTRRSGLMLGMAVALVAVARTAHAQTARELVDEVDRLMRGKSSHGTVAMDVVTEHWHRTMRMEIWSLGTEYALVRVLAPPREAGTATLKANNDIWNYLPNVDRTIKIPASMMGGSWMGSHLTNDDLVKESRLIQDYDISMDYSGPRDGVDVWELKLVPKPDAPVVWGEIIEQIRKSDHMPVWGKYYDERGNLARTITFSDYRRMSGRLVPLVMKVQPADKPDEHTTLTYSALEFDIGLATSFFSLQHLRTAGR